MKNCIYILILCILSFSIGGCNPATSESTGNNRPNIILILSDDMGYSDLGCYGSNIATPNLDALAENGLRYTQFYNGARCCPSRASLLTGLYPHQAGLGWMTAVSYDLPGYKDELNDHCVTIAQVLKKAGYATYMTGKWHVALNTKAGGPRYNWPLQRGFEKFYGIIKGASNYYDPATLCRGNRLITPFNDTGYHSDHYYLTNAISDNTVKFIRERDQEKPFFMYVAYTAAHWPMQAPEEAIEKYKGQYDQGWEAVRKARFKKMKELGVIPSHTKLSPPDARSWAQEKDKKAMARRMETYAAMISIMDRGIGKIINELKEEGIFNNTLILFLQDNGACAEPIASAGKTHPVAKDTTGLVPLGKNEIQYDARPAITRDGKIIMTGRSVMAGPQDTYVTYLQSWANASNTPFREYKHWVHEGGISTPLIVHWPDGIKDKGALRKQVCHEIDIMPTIVQLADATYPGEWKGRPVTPEAGVSLVPTFSNKPLPRRAIYWEHEMNRAVRMGKWKLVADGELSDGTYGRWKHYKNSPWELYNMEADRSELNNLASQYPKRVEQMAKMWNTWAHKTKVFPSPWQKEKNK